ncbi:MAG: ABC transporter permease [Ilumatobacteraceae bacterium]
MSDIAEDPQLPADEPVHAITPSAVVATSTLASAAVVAPMSERRQARRENLRLIVKRPGFIVGSLITAFWVVCAIFGDSITPKDPLDFRTTVHLRPSSDFLFGTDRSGRDVLSRVMAGARDVLTVAPLAAIIGVVAGTALGLIMGYFGGLVDNIISRIVEAFLSLPVLLIALLAITTLGRSKWIVIVVVSVLFIPVVSRTIRAAVLAERDLDYVTSARLRGESSPFIMFREILPNVSGPIIVELTVRIGYAVFTVATLSFVGAGPAPPSPDWGVQVSDGYGVLSANIWWPTIFPALAIASLVIAVNLIADAVQSVLEG